MSDCIINIRIWNYHFQVKIDYTIRFGKNDYWTFKKLLKSPMVIYELRPFI